MAGNKRKREDDDSDDDPSYGMRQILPVAALPANFSGEPVDGLQYLFTVRRDAKLLPGITRAPNPYEPDPLTAAAPEAELALDNVTGEGQDMLSEEWRLTFVRRFKGFRENLNQPTIAPPAPIHAKTMPDKKDREAWWDFMCGAPESIWIKPPSKRSTKPKRKGGGGLQGELDPSDPDVVAAGWQIVEPPSHPALDINNATLPLPAFNPAPAELASASNSPREPTPALLISMDHRMAIHLIMYFTYWINQYLDALDRPNTAAANPYTPLESHARWIFALLARVDSYCSADDMNGLRSLVRACLAFIRSQSVAHNVTVPNNDVRDADSDIASTPGVQPVELPPTEDPVNHAQSPPPAEETPASAGEASSHAPSVMSATSVRLILCAVAGFWNQRDLWTDAEGVFT